LIARVGSGPGLARLGYVHGGRREGRLVVAIIAGKKSHVKSIVGDILQWVVEHPKEDAVVFVLSSLFITSRGRCCRTRPSYHRFEGRRAVFAGTAPRCLTTRPCATTHTHTHANNNYKSNDKRLWLEVMPHPGAPAVRFVQARAGDASSPLFCCCCCCRRHFCCFCHWCCGGATKESFGIINIRDDTSGRRSKGGEARITDLLTKIFFSNQNLFGSGALLCWLSLVPQTDHSV
jgi:hypothetical protein